MTVISLSFCKHQRCLMDRDVCSEFFLVFSAVFTSLCTYTKVPVLLGCDPPSPTTFYDVSTLDSDATTSLETLGTSYSMKHIHFSEERRPQLHHRESVNCRIAYVVVSEGAPRESIILCSINYCTILFTA